MDSQISGRHFAICTHPCCKSGVRSRILALEVRGLTARPRVPASADRVRMARAGASCCSGVGSPGSQGRVEGVGEAGIAESWGWVFRAWRDVGGLRSQTGGSGSLIRLENTEFPFPYPYHEGRSRLGGTLQACCVFCADFSQVGRCSSSISQGHPPPPHPLAPFSFPVRRTDGEG